MLYLKLGNFCCCDAGLCPFHDFRHCSWDVFLLQDQKGAQKQRKSAFKTKEAFLSPRETFCLLVYLLILQSVCWYFSFLVLNIIEEVPRKTTWGSLKTVVSWEHYLKKQMLSYISAAFFSRTREFQGITNSCLFFPVLYFEIPMMNSHNSTRTHILSPSHNVFVTKTLTGLRPHGLQAMKVKFLLPTLTKNHSLFLCLIEVWMWL